MTDLSVTAANVLASGAAVKERGVAGTTITAGQTLYMDVSDSNKLKLADSDGASALRNMVGIALHGASSGQPLEYVISDPAFNPGATMTQGTIYVLSDTAGGLMPVADLEAGDYPIVVLVAHSASSARMGILAGTGVLS